MPKEPADTEGTETSSDAPWASDLEEAFEDEDVRSSVDEFLRKTVQPHITKIEQDSKPSRDATRLWDGFENQPVETSVAVVTELYGKEIADKFAELLQGGASPEEAAAKVEEDTDVDVSDTTAAEGDSTGKVKFEDLPPEVQDAVASQEQEKQREAYYSEIDRIKDERSDDLPKEGEGDEEKVVLDVDLFHPFVVAANGDFDTAADAYLKWLGQAKEKFGIQVPESAEGDEKIPPVIDSQTRDSGAKPPQKPEYADLDEAMDAFFDEQKTPPPTVGSA